MHEMHMIRNLHEDIIRIAGKNNVGRIKKVYLSMGEFTEIDEGILKYFFKENSVGTLLEGAEIDIKKSPNRELRLISFDCD